MRRGLRFDVRDAAHRGEYRHAVMVPCQWGALECAGPAESRCAGAHQRAPGSAVEAGVCDASEVARVGRDAAGECLGVLDRVDAEKAVEGEGSGRDVAFADQGPAAIGRTHHADGLAGALRGDADRIYVYA